jgi:Flp pilus assembly pilin Flp
MVEYALIIGLVALVAIAGLMILGPKLLTSFTNLNNKI